jgi:hypothetical protein
MDNQESSSKPSIGDSEWHDYVMSQFTPDELMKGNPTTRALRRVVTKLFGKIISSKPVHVYNSQDVRNTKVTVVYEVVIRDWPNGDLLSFGDACEVSELNCDNLFLAYAVASACTIAEGRTLRKALQLNCLAAEEIMKDEKSSEKAVAVNSESLLSPDQETFLDTKCRKLDIDVLKLVNLKGGQYRSPYDVPKIEVGKLVKTLTDYTNKPETIPDDIKGFQEWRIKNG